MTDETLAQSYCASRGYRYLSHETYGEMIAIAVEADGERWEERVSRSIAVADSALRKQGMAKKDRPPRQSGANIPKAPGFYWARWKIKDPGTAEEDDPPSGEWEVMHVVENCIDPDDDEYLMAMVPGVEKWQSLENFIWGTEVKR